MSRILFDVNVPRPLARLLTRHDVDFADLLGWREQTNGDLLSVADRSRKCEKNPRGGQYGAAGLLHRGEPAALNEVSGRL